MDTQRLISRNPVKAASLLASKVDAVGLDERIAETEQEIEVLENFSKTLLPIEGGGRHARASLTKKRADLRQMELIKNNSQYPQFPLEALSWRNRGGWPRLAVFSLSSPIFSMGVEVERRWGWTYRRFMKPRLPRKMYVLYKDVLDMIMREAKQGHKTMELKAEFSGLIPMDVKEEIGRVKNNFENIFVVAEVKKWVLESRRAKPMSTPRGDPLVVGWDGSKAWLVASFETTSVEEYVESLALQNQQTE